MDHGTRATSRGAVPILYHWYERLGHPIGEDSGCEAHILLGEEKTAVREVPNC